MEKCCGEVLKGSVAAKCCREHLWRVEKLCRDVLSSGVVEKCCGESSVLVHLCFTM